MGEVIDPAGEEISLFDASQAALKTIERTRKEAAMGAVEIQTPRQQIANTDQRQAMTPMEMLDHAVTQGASVETLSKLMDLQERWEANQARKAFDAAISAAKAEIPAIVRNATGHNNKRYADFSAIATVVDPILSKHGLSYRFRTTQTDKVTVTCVLSHKEGHSEETTLSGAPDTSGSKNAIQAIGSALTYLSRYSLMAALGLAATNDDDGRGAGAVAKTITEDQVVQIRELIEAVGADMQRFLAIGKIQRLEDMLAADFDAAVAMLKRKGQAA